MADLDSIKRTPESYLTKEFIDLCRSINAKRARTVIDHILKHGVITTEELSEVYGYDHAPRAVRDVRENGIPLITHRVTSQKTGRQIGAYTFDDVSKVKRGRIGGRKAFPKKFKQELINLYGARDAISGTAINDRYLQIDHRVPYEVAGDTNNSAIQLDARDFMLLDASSNRAKSWSCEHCKNFLETLDPSICNSCFWASPENYKHIALEPYRRVDITWSGDEVIQFEELKTEAKQKSISIPSLIKKKLSE